MASWTVEDATALRQAIALGATSVAYADRRVSYRTLGEMRALLRSMERELGLGDPRPRRRYPVLDDDTG